MFRIERGFGKEFSVKKIRLVFGRRKTGKSFFVENFVKFDKYLFVYRDRTIRNIESDELWSFNELKRYLSGNRNKTVVVDEFHRLPKDFLDFVHSLRLTNLILITSSLHFANEIMGKKSPVLGLVYPIKFDIFKPCVILKEISKRTKKDFLKYSLLLREPALLDLFNAKDKNFEDFLLRYYAFARYWVSALFGEIFEEEDRKLTEVYEAVLRAIAIGKNSSGEISSHLFGNGLISKDNPGLISPYLSVLNSIGLVDAVMVYGKVRQYRYRLCSDAIDFFFYLDSKYGSGVERKEIVETWNNKVSFYIEHFVERLLKDRHGLSVIKYSKPDREIDVCLKKFNKIEMIGSVKWTDLKKVSMAKVKKNLDLPVKNKFLLVEKKHGKRYVGNIRIYDGTDLLNFCK